MVSWCGGKGRVQGKGDKTVCRNTSSYALSNVLPYGGHMATLTTHLGYWYRQVRVWPLPTSSTGSGASQQTRLP